MIDKQYKEDMFGVNPGILINDNEAVNYTIDENVMGFDQFVVNTDWTE